AGRSPFLSRTRLSLTRRGRQSMNPTGQLVRTADITPGQREEMFALIESYYESVDRPTFDADLDEKEWVIQILDEETNRLKGFSTQMLFDVEVSGRVVRALF